MPTLGLADDEFTDNGGIPYQIYVREGRRIEGLATLTEADITPYIAGDGIRPPAKHDANRDRRLDAGISRLRRSNRAGQQIPRRLVVQSRDARAVPDSLWLPAAPRRRQPARLRARSARRISRSARCAWSRRASTPAPLRAWRASLALRQNCAPADVALDILQRELIARRSRLCYFADVGSHHPYFAAIQWAALRGFVPRDEHWRFFPDHPIDWASFVQVIVACLNLPISVSGIHFEGIGPRHASFAHVEALYDFGTRADVDLFRAKETDPRRSARSDPPADPGATAYSFHARCACCDA